MYHYVCEHSNVFPYAKFKNIEDFKNEISFLSRDHVFVGLSNGLERLCFENNDRHLISLTFDDSLKCHYEVALYLHSKSIPATFYIPSLPYVANDFISAHKAHIIAAKFGDKCYNLFIETAKKLYLTVEDIVDQSEESKFANQYNNNKDLSMTKAFKRIVNYSGEYSAVNIVLDKIINTHSLRPFLEDYYLSLSQIKDIFEMGHEIGSHSFSHRLLSRLSKSQQELELKQSKNFLESVLSSEINSFCYPYGRKVSYNDYTLQLLREVGYDNAVSVDSSFITDTSKSFDYELPRFDCNQIKSLFDFVS